MRMIAQALLVVFVILAVAVPSWAQEPGKVGIEEHLGEYLALDKLTFQDEQGKTIKLGELFDRPIVLTLVYFRCPGICTPLLLELAANVGKCDLTPGQDYRMVTISFDPDEGFELAANKKVNMIAQVENKEVPPDAWRFLTGDAENINAISKAMGFHYTRDVNGVDWVHAATVMFIAQDGQIVRYLNGTRFNPADLKMAVIDAAQGRPRAFIQRVERLCYSYDTEGRAYVLQVNRIILGITLLFVVAFGVFLLARRGHRPAPQPAATGSN